MAIACCSNLCTASNLRRFYAAKVELKSLKEFWLDTTFVHGKKHFTTFDDITQKENWL
jgi:hypothetical protein